MGQEPATYCVECGLELEPPSGFCRRCGAPRWVPGGPPDPRPEPAGARRDPGAAHLGVLPWVYAAGAVFLLVWTTQNLAVFVSPIGRRELATSLDRGGLPPDAQPTLLAVLGTLLIGSGLIASALHAAAFYGLRARRRWGWLAAVTLAGLWSLLLVGLPVLQRLLDRRTRRAFGVD